jgi:PAS domain S-box-containing protein
VDVTVLRPAPEGIDLERFVRLSGELLCIVDLRGTIVWCNQAFGRTLGYQAGQLRERMIDTLLHAGDAPDRNRAAEQLMEGQEVTGLQLRLQAADGSWRWLEWTSRVDLERGLAFGAARDTTARHDAEVALRHHEALSRAILWHSSSVIFVKDLNGRYLIVNNEYCRVTGYRDPTHVVGKTTAEIWPAHRAMIRDHEADLVASGGPQVVDESMDTPNGRRHYLMTRALLRDEDGTPVGLVGIGTDITARKEMEAELERRDRRLAAVLQASPDIIGILDAAGEISQISAAVETILGDNLEPVSPGSVVTRVHPDDQARVVEEFSELQTGVRHHLNSQFRMSHADGHWVSLDDRARSLVNDDGTTAGTVIVARDVSAKLESQNQLRAAIEVADQASRAKSEFLSRMSHELRTPLNAVLGFAQLLQMDELPEPHAEWVSLILSAGRQLLQLIDEVLDIARLETGHLDLVLESVSVAELVADAVASVAPVAEAAQVQLTVRIEDEDLVVTADRARLRQVLMNLLSNAIRFNRLGGSVEVRTEHSAPGWARLVVADTGRGIGAANLGRVFQPFERTGAAAGAGPGVGGRTGTGSGAVIGGDGGDGPFEGSGTGSGVSLALSKRLVEDMGGRLGVDSVPDAGSTFSIGLPVADAPDELAPPPARLGSPTTAAGPFRVMLVEEDLANLPLVERVLARRPGIEVMASMHGSLAIELAREHHPGLILLDLLLPDVPGTEVLERLRADPATIGIPVAVVSAEAPPRSVRHQLAGHVLGYLAKPLDIRALLALVDKARADEGTAA